MPVAHFGTPARVRQPLPRIFLFATRRLRFLLLGAYLRGWLSAPSLARLLARLPGPEGRP